MTPDKLRILAAKKLGTKTGVEIIKTVVCCKDLDAITGEIIYKYVSDADLAEALLKMVVEEKCTSKYMDGLMELYDETLVKLNWEVFIAMQTPSIEKIKLALNSLKKDLTDDSE